MKTYRTGFLLAVTGNIVLALIVAGLWWHYRTPGSSMSAQPQSKVTPIAQDSTDNLMASTPAMQDAPLVPIQISAQRLQSIGVKTGLVERKPVEDEIRTTGSVAIDETRLAYVQVRFSGYVQKVFADATYQYVSLRPNANI